MAILINFFDNVILQAISEEIVPKVSFFKDRYFPTGAGDIFKANESWRHSWIRKRATFPLVAGAMRCIPISPPISPRLVC